MTEIEERGIDAVVDDAIAEATEHADLVYVSVDVDVVDPGMAPGHRHPRAGRAADARAAARGAADRADGAPRRPGRDGGLAALRPRRGDRDGRPTGACSRRSAAWPHAGSRVAATGPTRRDPRVTDRTRARPGSPSSCAPTRDGSSIGLSARHPCRSRRSRSRRSAPPAASPSSLAARGFVVEHGVGSLPTAVRAHLHRRPRRGRPAHRGARGVRRAAGRGPRLRPQHDGGERRRRGAGARRGRSRHPGHASCSWARPPRSSGSGKAIDDRGGRVRRPRRGAPVPSSRTGRTPGWCCWRREDVDVVFTGLESHASSDPFLGRNALDAMITLFSAVGLWRQQLPVGRPGPRHHHRRRTRREHHPGRTAATLHAPRSRPGDLRAHAGALRATWSGRPRWPPTARAR